MVETSDGFLTDRDKIIEWMQQTFAAVYTAALFIESDGIRYNGSLTGDVKRLRVKFKSISGFLCCGWGRLSTLEGFPQSIGRYLDISSAQFTSLKGLPRFVGENLNISDNKITDPREYRHALYCNVGGTIFTGNGEIDNILSTYSGEDNRKHWAYAINLLSRVKL